MEIPETKRFIPKWFELGKTLSQPNWSIVVGMSIYHYNDDDSDDDDDYKTQSDPPGWIVN